MTSLKGLDGKVIWRDDWLRGKKEFVSFECPSAGYKRLFKLSPINIPSCPSLALPLSSPPSISLCSIKDSNSITGGAHLDAARENIILFEQIVPEEGVPVGMRRFLPRHEVDQQFPTIGQILHVDQLPT
jgi:hypothetical protein